MARLRDGFSTTISFSDYPSVEFWEKTVKPPGMDAGGPNDTTTMRNTRWRTRQPKQLVTATAVTVEVAYDPVVYEDIISMCGVNQEITITFPDDSTITFWGWLDKFEPGALTEGAQPTATATIEPSNENDSFVEVPPDYSA